MPYRCAVWGCSNTPDISKNIALHKIPFEADQRLEAKKRRRQWIKFVRTKRARWTPTRNSRVCSVHFTPEDFTRRFDLTSNSLGGEAVSFAPRLVSDEIGIVPIPSISARESSNDEQLSRRSRRMILKNIMQEKNEEVVKKDEEEKQARVKEEKHSKKVTVQEKHSFSFNNGEDEEEIAACNCLIDVEEDHEKDHEADFDEESYKETQTRDTATQTPDCYGCTKLASLNRQLRNKIVDLKQKLSEKTAAVKKLEKEKCCRK